MALVWSRNFSRSDAVFIPARHRRAGSNGLPMKGSFVMSIFRIAALLLMTFLMSACGNVTPAANLTNRQWQLIEINGQPPVVTDQPLTIEFHATNQVSGFAGCNGFSGKYRLEGLTIAFSDMISTLIACADNAISAQEAAFHGALAATTGYELADGELRLLDGDGMVLLRFRAP